MATEGDTLAIGSETRSEVGLACVSSAPRVLAVRDDDGCWAVAIASELEVGSGSDVELSCSMGSVGGRGFGCVPCVSVDVDVVYGNEECSNNSTKNSQFTCH